MDPHQYRPDLALDCAIASLASYDPGNAINGYNTLMVFKSGSDAAIAAETMNVIARRIAIALTIRLRMERKTMALTFQLQFKHLHDCGPAPAHHADTHSTICFLAPSLSKDRRNSPTAASAQNRLFSASFSLNFFQNSALARCARTNS